MTNPYIIVRQNREKPIINQHPWIFSGAIESVKGSPQGGDIITVMSEKNKFLARGYWNHKSQIQVRILTWRDEVIDDAWWRAAISRAVESRLSNSAIQNKQISAFRMINAENDYLPGLVVDIYGGWGVLQALTLGIDIRKEVISRLIMGVCAEHGITLRGVFERSDVDVRGKEGLRDSIGVLQGEEPPHHIEIHEGDLKYLVNVRTGHKTGFYLDQRENRLFFKDFMKSHATLAANARVLNLFSYTGGFGVAAFHADNAQIVNVDASLEALEVAEETFKLAASESDYTKQVDFIQADVFEFLRDQVEEGELYDAIICDPPKFAHNAGQVDRAARGYKDLNLHAFKLIKSGGYLMTFSCSGAITPDLFQKIVFGALADSGRQAQIVRHLTASDDHPIALTFPEGEYLKGLLLRVF